MVVVYCADRKLYTLLPTAINSLLSNNSVDKIYLLIEDDDIPYIKHQSIEFINCNNLPFLIRSGFNCNRSFPYMAMVRCFLTKILDEKKVIYLDVDTLVDKNLDDFWNMSLQGNYLAAKDEKQNYFNSGVLLLDLEKIRLSGMDDQAIDLLKTCKFIFPDQDVLNIVFRNHVFRMPQKYNAIGSAKYDKIYDTDISIRHFAGVIKPWICGAEQQDIDFWNKYYVDKIQQT